MLPFNPELKLSEATYNDNEYLGIERLDKARLSGSPELKEMLNSATVYAYGSGGFEKNFPILYQTQGKGNKKSISSNTGQFYNKMFGKPKKTSVVGKTIHQPDARTGEAYEDFYILFKDRQFMKNQILYKGGMDGIQLQVTADPVKEGAYYKYRVKIFGHKYTFVPYIMLQANQVWSGGVVKVSWEHSRGTEHRSYSPFETQNQLSIVRQSMKVAGNAARKGMNFDIKVGGKTFRYFYDWEKYLTDLAFNEAKDIDLLTSSYNKDAEGNVQNYDANSGKAVYSGMGLWDQIPSCNELPYTRMSESRLETYITDILTITQQLDLIDGNGNVVVEVLGGFGFLEEIDSALKRNTQLLTPIASSELYVKKDGNGLQYGNYFTSYRHRSGVILKFGHHKGFDYGIMADSSERHPQNPSRPMSSYDAIITNFGQVSVSSDVDKSGMSGNIQYVYEEGREYVEGYVRGMAFIEGRIGGDMSSDIDASSAEFMCTQGIHVHYPMSMGKIKCKIS